MAYTLTRLLAGVTPAAPPEGAAQQLADGGAHQLAEEVPQGHVYPGDGLARWPPLPTST